jgi:hypothetical protein
MIRNKITEATLRVSDSLIFRFVIDEFVQNDLSDRPARVKCIEVIQDNVQSFLRVKYHNETFEDFYGYKFSALYS